LPAHVEWNPRYLAYTRAHGEAEPVAMLRRDEATYPGGRMVGFMAWVNAQWRTWRRENPPAPCHEDEDTAFDAWLVAHYVGGDRP